MQLTFISIAVKTVLAPLKLWVKLGKVVGRMRDWNTSHILNGRRPTTTEKDIKRLLGIQEGIAYRVRAELGRVVVRVGKPREGAKCERCGQISFRVHQRMRWRRVKWSN